MMVFAYIDPGSGFTVSTLGGWFIVGFLGFFGIFLSSFKKFFKSFHRKQRAVLILITIIIVTGIISAIMMRMTIKTSSTAFKKRIVLLGLDGLSPNIIERMLGEGELPNFAKLKIMGSYRHLSTTNPPQSPVAWSAFATGKNPGKNGVYDFIIRNPKNYELSLSLSNISGNQAKRVLKTKAFWQYLSEIKVPCVILGCPITFPPDKIYGKMLSGMGVPDILGTEGTFTFYTTERTAETKDIGGNVFQIKRSSPMVLQFIGPKINSWKKTNDNVKTPFSVTLLENSAEAEVHWQGQRIVLKPRQWSNWNEVVFSASFFKKIRGIFKFYLVQNDGQGFKLYISPINFDPRNPYFPISYPLSYSRELAETLGLYYTMGMPIDTWAVNEKRLSEKALLGQADAVFNEKNKLLDHELARFKDGVFFFYFECPDIIQHMFWRYIDSGHPLYEASAPQEYKNTIADWYKKLDGVVGKVLQATGKDDTLIVFSDHGFDTHRRSVHVNSWLRQNGYLELKNPEKKYGEDLLWDIDWSKTKAYAIGFGAIYINQKGREKNGIVNPGPETENLKKEITEKLEKWTDEKYKTSIVKKIYAREKIFSGKYAKDLPDLYAGFNIGYVASWQTALGAVPETLIEDNLKKWSGSHLFDPELVPGIFFSNFRIKKENPSLYDLTPTILFLTGYDKEKLKELDLDGKSLV